MDLKTVATVTGMAISLASVAGTYAVMQYRVDALEERLAGVEADTEGLGDQIRESSDEVKCLICSAHDIRCPGC